MADSIQSSLLTPFNAKVELNKAESIGSGSYGAVCRAKYGKLTCAAKLLYSTLLEISDTPANQRHRTPLHRFRQECQFLSQVHHPNIVQYLGTYSDPDTGALVLLMELMEESLTHHLEQAQGTLQLYRQADIGHDIALALSYLHGNNIIHRDLTSNNILMRCGRAKVSDFGMSTIFRSTHGKNSQTICPGNVMYMSPEALDDSPQYDKSLDCFSYGVLLIQINSRLFPEPTTRFTTIEVIDPESQEAVDAKLPVSEVKRRQAHINMMEDSLLLPIALGCLSDLSSYRPSAEQICDFMEDVKESVEYSESRGSESSDATVVQTPKVIVSDIGNVVDGNKEKESVKKISYLTEKLGFLEDNNEQLRERIEELEQQLSSSDQLLSIRARELQRLNRRQSQQDEERGDLVEEVRLISEETEMLKMACHEMEVNTRQLNSTIEDLRRENDRCRDQIRLQDDTIVDLQSIVSDREDYISSTKAHLLAEMEDNKKLREQIETNERFSQRKGTIVHEVRNDWVNTENPSGIYKLECELRKRDRELKELKKFISIKDSHITSLEQQLQIMESKLERSKSLLKPPIPLRRKMSSNIKMEWKTSSCAPCLMQAGSTAAISKSKVYCRPANSEDIFEFSLLGLEWRQVKKCPLSAYTLVTIEDVLTTVGGMGSKSLLSLLQQGQSKDEYWQEIYPKMRIERFNASAAYSNNKLVVAGGFGRGWDNIPDVEVLDTKEHTWSRGLTLPYPIYSASAIICNNTVYIVGGYFEKARGHFSALACHMNAVTADLDSSRGPENSWHSTADLPVCRSTCVTLKGQLVVAGGRGKNGQYSNALYAYNVKSNSWMTVSDMSVARSECHVAVVNNDKIVVIGGFTESGLTDSVEIGEVS